MQTRQIGWFDIVLLYAATALSMASVGVVAALTTDLGSAFGVPAKAVGAALAMFSLPSALLSIFCGGVIDRFGARRAVIVSCLLCALGGLAVIIGRSQPALITSLVLNGFGFMGVSVAAPTIIVAASTGGLQVRAMSLWSTYAPAGFAAGLVMAAPVAERGGWALPFAGHVALMIALALLAFRLPASPARTGAAPSLRGQLRELSAALREPSVLRLAVAAAIPSALSYGTSLAAPAYLARVHGVSMGGSSLAVAVGKAVAMVACGLITGQILARSANSLKVFASLALIGAVAQAALFYPGSGFFVAVLGLILWLVAYGGAAATAMSLLPTVVKDPTRSGAASGVVSQAISILSFTAPAIYFGMQQWTGLVILAAAGLAISTAILPARIGQVRVAKA